LKAFITGIAGFAGSHLAKFLVTHTELDVSGLIHKRTENVSHLKEQLELHRGDLFDPLSIGKILSEAKPDYIFHLAGEPNVPLSYSSPWETFECNVLTQLNLLEAVRELAPRARVLIVGSAEEYGLVRSEDLPVREDTPLRPDSPYGVSKIAQDMMGLQYHLRYDMPVIRARAFNHIGARQTERFVASAFARQIAAIEAGLEPPIISVGNLSAERDFTDVRDTVRAYYLLLQHGEPGEVYNIGSGVAHSIDELLDILLSFVDIKIDIQVDSARLRPSDVPIRRCDYSKLHAATGWEPSIPFEKGLEYTLDYWRDKVGKDAKRK
jgi:GDP-4-dehydro-6-deoxy-D-mannose reductase